MKRIFNVFLLILLANVSIAQAPQGIPYQAVARNSSGAILASTAIAVRFTIRDSAATGAIKYRETHSVTTTTQGMFNVNIGQGTPVTGTFSDINWGTNSKFMQVEMDPAGGASYIDMGTTQMMSVPYAIFASKRPGLILPGDMEYWNGSVWVRIPGGTNGQTLSYCNGVPTWGQCPGFSSLTTSGVSSLTSTGCISGGNISYSGGSSVVARGVCWGTSPGPTIALPTKTSNGTGVGSFTSVISGLVGGVTYYVRSYATNSTGTAYGNEVTFSTLPSTVHSIGDTLMGGVVAYILQPGDPGYSSTIQHGIIAAPYDQSVGKQWGCSGTWIGTTSSALGTGQPNTSSISSLCGNNTAAYLCDTLNLNGFSDWYLPSLGELSKLYDNKVLIGGFANDYYWSSHEVDNPGGAWIVSFYYGNWLVFSKTNSYRVRAVRSF